MAPFALLFAVVFLIPIIVSVRSSFFAQVPAGVFVAGHRRASGAEPDPERAHHDDAGEGAERDDEAPGVARVVTHGPHYDLLVVTVGA